MSTQDSSLDPQTETLDDDLDEPLAIGGKASINNVVPAKKRKGLPPWAFFAVGGVVALMVLATILVLLLGGGSKSNATQDEVILESYQSSAAYPAAAISPGTQTQSAAAPQGGSAPAPATPATSPSQTHDGQSQSVSPADIVRKSDFDLLVRQVDELNARLSNVLETLASQPPSVRRILNERIAAGLENGDQVSTMNSGIGRVRRINYSDAYAISAVVGNRAWVRSAVDQQPRDWVVSPGDQLESHRVVEVNAIGKYVLLSNGQRIR